MTYVIAYRNPVDEVFAPVDREDKNQALNKMYEIAANEFRNPYDYDFQRLPQFEADGRFRVGDSLRVIATVDRKNEIIYISEVCSRENLY